jgi:hypothetical protein
VNHAYGKSGTLWEGQHKGCLISSDDYLLACMRYKEVTPTGNCSEAYWIQTRCVISGPRCKPGLRWGTIASGSRLSRPCVARSGNRVEAGPRKLQDKGTDPF